MGPGSVSSRSRQALSDEKVAQTGKQGKIEELR